MVNADSEMMFHNSIIVPRVGAGRSGGAGCGFRSVYTEQVLKVRGQILGSNVLVIEKVATDWRLQ